MKKIFFFLNNNNETKANTFSNKIILIIKSKPFYFIFLLKVNFITIFIF